VIFYILSSKHNSKIALRVGWKMCCFDIWWWRLWGWDVLCMVNVDLPWWQRHLNSSCLSFLCFVVICTRRYRRLPSLYVYTIYKNCGPGSSVGIATDYGLDGQSRIKSRWGEIFRPSGLALGPTQPPVKWGTGSFPGVKCGQGVLLTTHPLLVPRSWKSRAIPLPNLWATPGL